MKIHAAVFVKSCVTPDQFPSERLPEVAFVGRSNIGKSSAINALTNVNGLAKVGKVPGKTQTINFFRLTTSDARPQRLYLVDLPGYGYAKVPKSVQLRWRPMIEGYLSARDTLCGALVFIDIRGAERSDGEIVRWLQTVKCPTAIVATKVDKIARGRRHSHINKIREDLMLPSEIPLLLFSARTHEGRVDIVRTIQHFIDDEI